MNTPQLQLEIADQLDLVVRQLCLHKPDSKALQNVVRPLLNHRPDEVSEIVALHNAASGSMRDDLKKAINQLVSMNPLVNVLFDPDTAKDLNEVANRIRSAANDPDAELKRGLELWNDGASWSDVNEKLGRNTYGANATEKAIKRFAEKNNLDIRKGNAGRKPKA